MRKRIIIPHSSGKEPSAFRETNQNKDCGKNKTGTFLLIKVVKKKANKAHHPEEVSGTERRKPQKKKGTHTDNLETTQKKRKEHQHSRQKKKIQGEGGRSKPLPSQKVETARKAKIKHENAKGDQEKRVVTRVPGKKPTTKSERETLWAKRGTKEKKGGGTERTDKETTVAANVRKGQRGPKATPLKGRSEGRGGGTGNTGGQTSDVQNEQSKVTGDHKKKNQNRLKREDHARKRRNGWTQWRN